MTKRPKVHTGIVMASGSKVVGDSKTAKALVAPHRKASALEMEAVGVAAAARDAHPFLVIKAVSDFANDSKDDAWHPFAARAAAEFAVSLFANIGRVRVTSSEL